MLVLVNGRGGRCFMARGSIRVGHSKMGRPTDLLSDEALGQAFKAAGKKRGEGGRREAGCAMGWHRGTWDVGLSGQGEAVTKGWPRG